MDARNKMKEANLRVLAASQRANAAAHGPCTSKSVMRAWGSDNINTVAPRASALLKAGLIRRKTQTPDGWAFEITESGKDYLRRDGE